MTFAELRLYYKLELLYNKYSPFFISLIVIIYHTIKFLTEWDIEWIEYCFFPSLLTSLHMYNTRETFMLCKVHRCFVNYVVANIFVCISEHYWINPYRNEVLFAFIMVGTTVVLLLAILYYTLDKNRKKLPNNKN